MDANLHSMLLRVNRSITAVQAMRAVQFNRSWPMGHPDRDHALNKLRVSNPSLLEAVSRIEREFGPGTEGCERALSE